MDEKSRNKAREEIERQTAEFLANGGKIDVCPNGDTNWQPTIQIIINSDADRKRRAKKGPVKK